MSVSPDAVAGRPPLLRTINEQNVLNLVREAGTISRRDIADRSGLSKPTIGLTLENLAADGLVRVAGKQTGHRGPSALLYELSPDAAFVLSIDVGNDFLRGAVADISGTVRARDRHAVHGEGRRFRPEDLGSLVSSLLDEAGIGRDLVTQAVVGAPGVYPSSDPPAGPSRRRPWPRPDDESSPVSAWRDVLGTGLLLENDVNLAALAEMRSGHGTEVDTFVFVSVGTGIGMGLVLNGTIHTGARGAAGEIGFVPVHEPGARAAGAVTPLGIRTSSFDIIRRAHREGMEGTLTARDVFQAARQGDRRAGEIVQRQVELVAESVVWAVTILDPGLVVLGGGIGRSPGFAERVTGTVEEMLLDAPPIRTSALGEEGVVEGGLVAGLDHAWRALLGNR